MIENRNIGESSARAYEKTVTQLPEDDEKLREYFRKVGTSQANNEQRFQLSHADQAGPRHYVRLLSYFPFNDGGKPEIRSNAVDSLLRALGKVLCHWPHLSGKVEPLSENESKGRIRLCDVKHNAPWCVPVTVVVHSHDSKLLSTFEDMRKSHFPSKCSPGDILHQIPQVTEHAQPIPVLAIQINFIEGGLILAPYLHHSVGDGYAYKTFVEMWAAATRDDDISQYPSCEEPPILRSEEHEKAVEDNRKSMVDLIESCRAVYRLLPQDRDFKVSRPVVQPVPRTTRPDDNSNFTGRIFRFKNTRVLELKALIDSEMASRQALEMGKFTSTNDCLFALFLAHCSRARFQQKKEAQSETTATPQFTKAMIAVEYRKRIDPTLPPHYFGMGVTVSHFLGQVSKLNNACHAATCLSGRADLANTARSFRSAIQAVDSSKVYDYLALSKALPDVRSLTFAEDGAVDFDFNTWANIGADCEWIIPGKPVESGKLASKPAIVRRPYYAWGEGSCLVLPRQSVSDYWDVLVQLKTEHMDRLLTSKEWMEWVYLVIN